MKVVIIGTGNVATIVGKKMLEAGHEIIQVIGRNAESAAQLSATLKSNSVNNILKVNDLGDLYLISVSDSAISSIASQLKLNNKIVAHTAGAVSKEVLAGCSENYGVLYPLQTLRKEVNIVPPIPILVDANNQKTISQLKDFAIKWADNVEVANDEERLKLHVAAVFVNNFTNHLFTVAEKFCNSEHLNFNLLHQIIKETIVRIENNSPSSVQTGPAIRKDLLTIQKHNNALQNYPQLRELYNILSNSIVEFYTKISTK